MMATMKTTEIPMVNASNLTIATTINGMADVAGGLVGLVEEVMHERCGWRGYY